MPVILIVGQRVGVPGQGLGLHGGGYGAAQLAIIGNHTLIPAGWGAVEILLTGDAGTEFESPFTRDPAAPPIRVLKVGHHGSKTSSSEHFLDAYAPTAAVVSAGQGNLFGHPAPVVIGRLSQRDIDVFRTDRDGAIVIETDGRVARVQAASGRLLTVTASRFSPAATPPPSLP